MPVLNKYREQISEMHPSTVIEVRVRDLADVFHEVEGIERDRDRWAERVKVLEKRLHDVVAVASGVQP